ncbi:MAG: antitoxin [Methanoregula sp.]|nr:antitoxin [Methanoregula sp.]
MSTKTIRITNEAYEKLKNLKTRETSSFSKVIVKYYPARRKLSDVLVELGDCTDLAVCIRSVSQDLRKAKLRNVRF